MQSDEEVLTEAAMAVVHHEVSTKGTSSEVVDAAGAVRHVPHHDGVCVREPGTHTHQWGYGPCARPVVSYRSDQYSISSTV